jgi:phosphoribosylformylglycinamidine synthase
MAEACKQLDFPVVSGNVSLYNETDGVAIPPTPVCGGVGLIEDVSKIATLKGAQPGDVLILIGETKGHLGASLYAREILGLEGDALGPPPPVDLEIEKRNADFVRSLIEQGLVNAVHDVSDGGIACAVAEMALASNLEFHVTLDDPANDDFGGQFPNWKMVLFGEDAGRYVLSCGSEYAKQILNLAKSNRIRITGDGSYSEALLGEIAANGAPAIKIIEEEFSSSRISLPLSRLREANEGWLPTYMSKVD